MYATMRTGLPSAGAEEPPDLQRLVDAVAGQPGCIGAYGWRPIGAGGSGLTTSLIMLWETEHDARRSAERGHDGVGPRWGELASDLIYEVRAGEGPAHRTARAESRPGDPPAAVRLLGYLH